MKTRHAMLALVLVLAAPLPAQAPPLAVGARIRVVPTDADGTWAVEGRLLRLRPDSVTIEPSYPLFRARAFALDGNWRVEAATRGHRHVGRRVLWGAGIGAAVLGLMAGVSYEPCRSQEFLGCMLTPRSAADAAAWGATGGALLGGTVGLVIGLLVRDVQWAPVRAEGVSIGAAPLSSRRLGVGASLGF